MDHIELKHGESPFDQSCGVCATVIGAGLEYDYLSWGDDRPGLLALCADCARPARTVIAPLSGRSMPRPEHPLPIRQVLSMAAQNAVMFDDGDCSNAGVRLLNRFGWTMRETRGLPVCTGLADAGHVVFSLRDSGRGWTCILCMRAFATGGVLDAIPAHGAGVLCDACARVLDGMARDGWVDADCLPALDDVIRWTGRFTPEESRRIGGRRVAAFMPLADTVHVILADGRTVDGVPEQGGDGSWSVGGRHVIDRYGMPCDGVQAVFLSVEE